MGILQIVEANNLKPLIITQLKGSDIRINALERQVRFLNGQVEELEFELKQLRKILEQVRQDNEFRFQQFEKKDMAIVDKEGINDQKKYILNDEVIKTIDDFMLYDEQLKNNIDHGESAGTLVLDEEGNFKNNALGKPLDLTVLPKSNQNNLQINDQSSDDPDILYRQAYSHLQSGDYQMAESKFQKFKESYPDDPRIVDAHYWLGESMFLRGKFKESASLFLEAHKSYADTPMGPDILLKLGLSLAGMNQRELACITYRKIQTTYPSTPKSFNNKLVAEKRAAGCQ